MSMSINPAQDEFDALISRNKSTGSTRHPEDSSSRNSSIPSSRSSTPDSSTDDASTMATAAAPARLPRVDFEANTGPKGVIADAIAFNRARKSITRQTFYTMATGMSEKLVAPPEKRQRRRGSREKESSGEDEDDHEDEGFMRTWRMGRMAELQAGKEVRSRRISPSKRRWGKLTKVGAIGYLDAVEKVTADTIVVVFINDDESAVSGVVEDALTNVARKHETTRFIKLHYEEAEMDPVSIPAILAYRNGELIANLVSVIDYIPDDRDMSSSSLEKVLVDHQVLS